MNNLPKSTAITQTSTNNVNTEINTAGIPLQKVKMYSMFEATNKKFKEQLAAEGFMPMIDEIANSGYMSKDKIIDLLNSEKNQTNPKLSNS